MQTCATCKNWLPKQTPPAMAKHRLSYLFFFASLDLPAATAILLASCVGRALSRAGAAKVDQGVRV